MRGLGLALSVLLGMVSVFATGCDKPAADKPAEVDIQSVPPEAEFEREKSKDIDPNNP